MGGIETMKLRLLVLPAVTLLLYGCFPFSMQKTDIPCAAILNPPFRQLIGATLSTEQALQIIRSTYGVQSKDVNVERVPENPSGWASKFPEFPDIGSHIFWRKAGVSYRLDRDRQEKLQHIFVEFGKVKPPVRRVIQCVSSQPEWYRALYGPRMESSGLDYYFELWFPSKGVVTQTRGSARNKNRLPKIDSKFPVAFVDIVAPGTVIEVYENLGLGSGYLPPGDDYPLIRWPDDWSQVQLREGW